MVNDWWEWQLMKRWIITGSRTRTKRLSSNSTMTRFKETTRLAPSFLWTNSLLSINLKRLRKTRKWRLAFCHWFLTCSWMKTSLSPFRNCSTRWTSRVRAHSIRMSSKWDSKTFVSTMKATRSCTVWVEIKTSILNWLTVCRTLMSREWTWLLNLQTSTTTVRWTLWISWWPRWTSVKTSSWNTASRPMRFFSTTTFSKWTSRNSLSEFACKIWRSRWLKE